MKKAGLLFLAACFLFADSAAATARNERYILLLQDLPLAAATPEGGKNLTRSARALALTAKQSALAQALGEHKIRITATDQVLVNAIFVEAPANSEATLSSLPGVDRVERLRPLKRHLDTAVNLMNVPAAWSAVNGPQNAGAGVKIAILDTGIDIGTPAMQDTSLQYPSGFPKCNQESGNCAWVNTKVIAARSYVGMLVGTDPATSRPDDLSPRDRDGHGTAVATVAAGVRTSGPSAAIQGVAPRAWLGNYKIFGSPGVNGTFTSEDVVLTALRDAREDGMDIAVLTVGTPAEWGPGDTGAVCQKSGSQPCDWRAAAVENATRQGLTVITSAGNDGDNGSVYPAFNSVNSPGTATSAITVGATTNSHIYSQGIQIVGPGVPADLARITTYFSDGPRPTSNFRAPLRDTASAGNDGRACSPLSANALSGTVALVARGGCDFVTKIFNVQNAGAIGILIYQSAAGVNGTFRITGVEETGIPAALIGNRAGAALRAYIAGQSGAQAVFDPAFTAVSTTEFDTMASFSSRGPSIRESAIKPELVAVGTDLYTATQTYDPNGRLYDPSGFTAVQGTSFAAPLVAGAVAMVKQRYPAMTPAQLKSAVVNTANNRIQDLDENRIITASVVDQGAGKLDAGAAVQSNVTVEPATVSFGIIGDALPSTSTPLRFCNFGSATASLRLSVFPAGQNSSASVSLSSSSVSLGPNSCNSSTTVRLTGSRPRPGIYEGDITVAGGSVPLHIPYLYLVGDAVPFSIFPLLGDRFEAVTSVNKDLVFKVVDRYGVPVSNAAVRFQTVTGGGTISSEGRNTDQLGIGYATAVTGTDTGEAQFFARVGNNPNFGIYFSGLVRPASPIRSDGIADAASQESGRAFAPGSYISIYGSGLSQSLRSFTTPYLPLALAGVSVSFDLPSQGGSYPGRIQFVSERQINVQIPWELQGASSAQVKVSIGDYSSAPVSISIASAAPSLFEYSDSGRLSAAAVNGAGAVIGTANPARRGDVISLYANGLGAVQNQPASGDPASTTTLAPVRNTPSVTVGGRPAEVTFAGLAPGYVGLYQMNVRVPGDVSAGAQPIVVTSNGVGSKASNIVVAQ